MEGRGRRNWLELPPELTSSILHRLGAFEILENAQKVCRSWRDLCREPSMWQIIDMKNNMGEWRYIDYDRAIIMCRNAINRSQGGLIDINIEYFGTDDLLQYIVDSSSNLRRLRLARCYSIREAVVKLPLLEDLEVSYCLLSRESLRVIGQSCPNLKTLKLNNQVFRDRHWQPYNECNEDALTIAKTMPGLRHLQLFGNKLTETGLNAILENCPHLEHLDLRQCFNIELVGNLEKQCCERIKVVRRPDDPTDDYPFDATVIAMVSLEDEYPYHFNGASDAYDFDDHDDAYDYHFH